MKSKIQFFLAVGGTIIIFDTIASLASRFLEFDYTALGSISLLLYASAGFFGCKYFNFLTGIMAGLIVGFIDSTFGWAISTALKPYIPFDHPVYTFPIIAEIIITISITGAFFGLVGSFVAYLIGRK